MRARLLLQGPVVVQVPTPPTPPSPPDIPLPPELIALEALQSGPPEWVGVVAVLALAIIGATIVLFPLARAWARRMDRGHAAPQLGTGDVTARLERIEHAVEAMAVEVERISEGQRFLTRVMADLHSLPGDAVHAEPARLGGEVLPPSERRR